MKRIITLILALVLVLGMVGCGSKKAIQEKIQSKIDSWTEKNGISIEGYTYEQVTNPTPLEKELYDGVYSLTIEWDEFENLTPEQMASVVKTWYMFLSYRDKQNKSHEYIIDLDWIISNGNTYKIYANIGGIELNGETIVKGKSSVSTSTNSSGTGNSNGYTAGAEKCDSCGQYYSDATNKNYLAHTHLCKNCYQNYCWATGKTPSNYDK